MTRMDCEHVVDYLNGSLTAEEAREFEEHLASCEDCREILAAAGELPYLAESAEPPAGMKDRILGNVFAEEKTKDGRYGLKAVPVHEEDFELEVEARAPRERIWWRPILAAVLLFSLLGNAYAFLQLSEREEPAAETAFQSVELQPSEEFPGAAKAAIIRDEASLELVVQAEALEALEGDEVYQVWLLKDGQPIPAGAFTPGETGEGSTYFTLEEDTEGWDTIAVTREPEAGNEAPEGDIVLSSSL